MEFPDADNCSFSLEYVSLVLSLTLSSSFTDDFLIVFEELLEICVTGMFTSCVDLPSLLSIPYVRRILLVGGPRLPPILPTSSITSAGMFESQLGTFLITLLFFGDCLCVSKNIVGDRPRL